MAGHPFNTGKLLLNNLMRKYIAQWQNILVTKHMQADN